jgi:membrane protein YqaA with SNARE-associated domain
VTPPDAATPRPNVIRRIYEWVLSWADSPYGAPALFVLAFAESSFFPVPPDILLIALALGAPTRAFWFALWCTVGSVLGGLFGYYLGFAVWGALEHHVLGPVFSRENFEWVMDRYRENGGLWVFIAGFSPVPYKVFTLAAGVAKLDLVVFTAASAIGRGARFVLVAWLVKSYGDRARHIIERNFNMLTLVLAAAVVGGFVLIKLMS